MAKQVRALFDFTMLESVRLMITLMEQFNQRIATVLSLHLEAGAGARSLSLSFHSSLLFPRFILQLEELLCG